MTPQDLTDVMDKTWPAAAFVPLGPWLLRRGDGGGQRVSAATLHGPLAQRDIAAAEKAMRGLGQTPLFTLRAGEDDLDSALGDQGYKVVDPVLAYAMPITPRAQTIPIFAHWPPLAICQDLWQQGGIGPARVAVMHRAAGPKTALLARAHDRCVGAAFVAMAGETAMLHALEVSPAHRRTGIAQALLDQAVIWAATQSALRLTLVVTAANAPARALYERAGMHVVGSYHYRRAGLDRA